MKPLPPVDLNLNSKALGPVTDLYQLTMMAGYDACAMNDHRAVFELFVRKLPSDRSYLVFAGLEQALEALIQLRFDQEQVNEIRGWPIFASVSPSWFDRLLDFRFEGDVWSIPEGTVVFAGEPLLRVEASLPQAQLVETLLLAMIGYPTMVASKASRIVDAAQGRGVIDFGARRGHGIQASFISARSAYLAGFEGTSQVEAARRLGIPALGTMAHSWVQSFPDEESSFRAFAQLFPRSTLLVDTYDTEEGVRLAAAIEPPIRAIRIDSGDLVAATRRARTILDQADRCSVRIIASGDLEEHTIADLIAAGAPIDEFGVGTELITSRDAPSLSMVYKLVEINNEPRIKNSSGKQSYPYGKQVDRRFREGGLIESDQVVRHDEPIIGVPLLEQVIRGGRLCQPLPTLDAIRERCRSQRDSLPPSYRGLEPNAESLVHYSEILRNEADRLRAGLNSKLHPGSI